MRLILIFLTLIVIASGAIFGALNGARIPVDFYFFQVNVPTGVGLLGMLLIGWLLGGLVAWLGQTRRLRHETREARASLRELDTAQARKGGDR
ncbi:MAG: lipopolysaccharide assembly protein LapA domain-containing protein [Dokdonella sp.]